MPKPDCRLGGKVASTKMTDPETPCADRSASSTFATRRSDDLLVGQALPRARHPRALRDADPALDARPGEPTAAMAPIRLNDRWRVVDDPLQWLLERRASTEHPRQAAETYAGDEFAQKNTPPRGVWTPSAFCATRAGLLRNVRERCGAVDPEALAIVAALPERHIDYAPSARRPDRLSSMRYPADLSYFTGTQRQPLPCQLPDAEVAGRRNGLEGQRTLGLDGCAGPVMKDEAVAVGCVMGSAARASQPLLDHTQRRIRPVSGHQSGKVELLVAKAAQRLQHPCGIYPAYVRAPSVSVRIGCTTTDHARQQAHGEVS